MAKTLVGIPHCVSVRVIFLFLISHLSVEGQNILGTVSTDVNKVRFFLFANPFDEDERMEIVFGDRKSVLHSGYNSSLPLTVLMHGALSNSLTHTDVRVIKDAFLLAKHPTNVLMVDFGPLAQSGLPLYVSSLSILTAFFSLFNAGKISERVADMIVFLMRCHVLERPGDVHLIGFSLSGALVGFVGKIIQRKTLRKIGRISGLDSMPYLSLLDKSDAEFVDMTHTRFGIVPPYIPPIVHAQFYINGGGPHQPNCPNLWPFVETYCSHSTAVFYFAKSVKKKPVACRCTSSKHPVANCYDKAIYGLHLSPQSRGNFCVHMD